MKEFFIKWERDEEKGIFAIIFKGNCISLKTIKGCCPLECTMGNMILGWLPFREALKEALASCPERKNPYAFWTREGMSGCKDTYILTKVKGTSFVSKKKIWHESMRAKFNEDLEIYARDLVDWVQQEWGNAFTDFEPVDDLVQAIANCDKAELIEPFTTDVEWHSSQCDNIDYIDDEEIIEENVYGGCDDGCDCYTK